jgi:transcriptional regulator with XRE-family HTH domain
MKLRDAKGKLLKNDKVRAAFQEKDINDLKIDVGLQILELRILKNLTQAKLAKLIGTEQPSIARVERGTLLPSLSFLHKIAKAVDTELIPPRFALVEANERQYLFSTQLRETREFNFDSKHVPTAKLKSLSTDGEKTFAKSLSNNLVIA